VDPDGLWYKTAGNYWVAVPGDSRWTLSRDANIPLSFATECIINNNEMMRYHRTTPTMVYANDAVLVPTPEMIDRCTFRIGTVSPNPPKSQSNSETYKPQPFTKKAMDSYIFGGNPDGVEIIRRYLECTVADWEKRSIDKCKPYLITGGQTIANLLPITWGGNFITWYKYDTDVWGNKTDGLFWFSQFVGIPGLVPYSDAINSVINFPFLIKTNKENQQKENEQKPTPP